MLNQGVTDDIHILRIARIGRAGGAVGDIADDLGSIDLVHYVL